MIHEPPVCLSCRHYRRSEFRACDAFPDRIPDEIWIYVDPHKKPFPGDRGIQFEPVEPLSKAAPPSQIRPPSPSRSLNGPGEP